MILQMLLESIQCKPISLTLLSRPTFHIYHKGDTVGETIIGSDPNVIKKAFETIASGKRFTSLQK
jgi:hypothetical protein